MQTESVEDVQALVGTFRPAKMLRIAVTVRSMREPTGGELFRVAMDAAPQLALRQDHCATALVPRLTRLRDCNERIDGATTTVLLCCVRSPDAACGPKLKRLGGPYEESGVRGSHLGESR